MHQLLPQMHTQHCLVGPTEVAAEHQREQCQESSPPLVQRHLRTGIQQQCSAQQQPWPRISDNENVEHYVISWCQTFGFLFVLKFMRTRWSAWAKPSLSSGWDGLLRSCTSACHCNSNGVYLCHLLLYTPASSLTSICFYTHLLPPTLYSFISLRPRYVLISSEVCNSGQFPRTSKSPNFSVENVFSTVVKFPVSPPC